MLADGRQTKVLVTDNNFGATQFMQFVVLAISPVPEPASAVLMPMGLGAVPKGRRRARPAK